MLRGSFYLVSPQRTSEASQTLLLPPSHFLQRKGLGVGWRTGGAPAWGLPARSTNNPTPTYWQTHGFSTLFGNRKTHGVLKAEKGKWSPYTATGATEHQRLKQIRQKPHVSPGPQQGQWTSNSPELPLWEFIKPIGHPENKEGNSNRKPKHCSDCEDPLSQQKWKKKFCVLCPPLSHICHYRPWDRDRICFLPSFPKCLVMCLAHSTL